MRHVSEHYWTTHQTHAWLSSETVDVLNLGSNYGGIVVAEKGPCYPWAPTGRYLWHGGRWNGQRTVGARGIAPGRALAKFYAARAALAAQAKAAA